MLFLVVQQHTPEMCPARDGRGPEALFDGTAVELRFAVADIPGHKLFFLVEAQSYDALNRLLEPGRTRCITSISPVREIGSGT